MGFAAQKGKRQL
uniref:Uncharacterized protein n=1 Tax=Anguilla anguilla TaxID=7936 RepID=A0A0E9UHF3_ANGAN